MEKHLESFNTTDMPTLKKIVSKTPTKSCELDPEYKTSKAIR